MLSRYCHPRKIEKGKNPIVTDGGAMQRRTGETFVKWAKRINLEIHEEKSAWGALRTRRPSCVAFSAKGSSHTS